MVEPLINVIIKEETTDEDLFSTQQNGEIVLCDKGELDKSTFNFLNDVEKTKEIINLSNLTTESGVTDKVFIKIEEDDFEDCGFRGFEKQMISNEENSILQTLVKVEEIKVETVDEIDDLFNETERLLCENIKSEAEEEVEAISIKNEVEKNSENVDEFEVFWMEHNRKESQANGTTSGKITCAAASLRLTEIRSSKSTTSQKELGNQNNCDVDNTSRYNVRKIFSFLQESKFVEYLQECSHMNYGINTNLIKKLAFEFAEKNNISTPLNWKGHKAAGNTWLQPFLVRQHLNIRKPGACSFSKINRYNSHNVFFDSYTKILTDYPTINENLGARIFSLDEVETTIVSGEILTTYFIISGSGAFLPPVHVIPRKYFKYELIEALDDALAIEQPGLRINSDIFVQVLEIFIKHTNSSRENPTLLIYDDHESHTSIEIMDKARENGVVLLTLPPLSKYKMQPLDLGVFLTYKASYNTACDSWMYDNLGTAMKINDIIPLVNGTFKLSVTPANIIAGFRDTGIYPFNPDIFRDDDSLSSASEANGESQEFNSQPSSSQVMPKKSSSRQIYGSSDSEESSSSSDVNEELAELRDIDLQIPDSVASQLMAEMKLISVITKHALDLFEEEELVNVNNSSILQLHEEITNMNSSAFNVIKIIEQSKELNSSERRAIEEDDFRIGKLKREPMSDISNVKSSKKKRKTES